MKRTQLLVLALLPMLFYLMWNCLYYMPFTVDDAFISLRYARNLTEGHGLVYNPGEHVEGFSNFSWVILAATLMRLGVPVLTTLKALGVLLALGTAVATFFLVRRCLALHAHSDLIALFATGMLCTNTSVALWSQAGLETMLFTLLLVLTSWRVEVERELANRAHLSAILIALLAMTRPEAPLYCAYFGIRRLLGFRGSLSYRPAFTWMLLTTAPLIAYESWGLWYFSHLLPNTFVAKIGYDSPVSLAAIISYFTDQRSLVAFLTLQGWGLPAILLAGVTGCAVFRRRDLVPLVAPLFCGLFFVLYAQWDWMPRHRLFVPVLPFLFAAAAFGLRAVLTTRELKPYVRTVAVLTALVCVGNYFFVQFTGSDLPRGRQTGTYARVARLWWPPEVPARIRQRIFPLEGLAEEILRSVPEGEFVALRDIGYPGYLTNNPLWDTFGLVTPTAASARDAEDTAAELAAYEDLMSRTPGMIVLPLGRRQDTLSRRLLARLETDPDVRHDYTATRFSTAFGYPFPVVLFLRNDLPEFEQEARKEHALQRADLHHIGQ